MADALVLEQLAGQLDCSQLRTDGRPRVVARPCSVADVVSCVQAAGRLGCSVSVVGGNHSGYGQLGDLVLEMEHSFGNVEADPETSSLRVEAGVKLSKIAAAAEGASLVVPLGTAPTVGIGLILQGGVGHYARRLGLALDAVRSVQLVSSSGQVLNVARDASEESERELFWAVCGCAPNFGVVTSLALGASKIPSCSVTRSVFQLPPGVQDAAALVERYMRRSHALPRDCSSDCCLYFATAEAGSPLYLGLYDYNLGGAVPPADMSDAKLVSESAGGGLSPGQLMEQEPYLCEQPHGVVHRGFLSKRKFYTRALFFGPGAEIGQVLVESLLMAPSRHCIFHFQHMGGAVADGSGAFLARGAEWSLVVTGSWVDDEEDSTSWVKTVLGRLLPLALGCYATDLGPEDLDLAPHTFGSHAARLQQLKQKWDPTNMFRHGFPLAELSQSV